MKRISPLCLLAVLALVLFSSLTSCERRDIRQVAKEIAEAPVDTFGFAEKTVRTNAFSSVSVDCFADVTYHQTPTSQPTVRLRAPRDVLSHIAVQATSGQLAISTFRRYRMPEKAVIVVDIYAPFINKVTLNGGKCLRLGNVQLQSPFAIELLGIGAVTASHLEAPELSLDVEGQGSADLRGIATNRLSVNLDGLCQAQLQGTAATLTGSVSGESIFTTDSLRTSSRDVKESAPSRAAE